VRRKQSCFNTQNIPILGAGAVFRDTHYTSLLSIYQMPPMSDARGGQTGLKVLEKTYLSPQLSHKWRSSFFLKILSDVDVMIRSGKQFQLSHNLLEKANFQYLN